MLSISHKNNSAADILFRNIQKLLESHLCECLLMIPFLPVLLIDHEDILGEVLNKLI